MCAYADTLWNRLTPLVEDAFLLGSFSKEKHTATRITACDAFHHLIHQPNRIYLALVGGKRGYAYPLDIGFLRTDNGWKKVEIAAFIGED